MQRTKEVEIPSTDACACMIALSLFLDATSDSLAVGDSRHRAASRRRPYGFRKKDPDRSPTVFPMSKSLA